MLDKLHRKPPPLLLATEEVHRPALRLVGVRGEQVERVVAQPALRLQHLTRRNRLRLHDRLFDGSDRLLSRLHLVQKKLAGQTTPVQTKGSVLEQVLTRSPGELRQGEDDEMERFRVGTAVHEELGVGNALHKILLRQLSVNKSGCIYLKFVQLLFRQRRHHLRLLHLLPTRLRALAQVGVVDELVLFVDRLDTLYHLYPKTT